jgi:uncharacterized membrane protein YphA (DoxX/SURF4 family)
MKPTNSQNDSVVGMTQDQKSVAVAAGEPSDWNLWPLIGFRFAFCYFVLYNFVILENLGFPGTDWIVAPYLWVSQALTSWVAKHIFRLSRDIIQPRSGSGDTTYDYLNLLCIVTLTIVIGLIWTLLDRRQKHYHRLNDWLRVYIRYTLALTLLTYGMSKVIKTQFAFPNLATLIQPFGDQKPQGLLWNFMGYSTAYTFFGGAAEVLGGSLLFFRRTTTFGALVSGAVMFNVALMNFCYDVPVKLLSSNMLLMSVFLVVPDIQRLGNFLVLNRATAPKIIESPFHARWTILCAKTAKFLLIGFALSTFTRESLADYRQAGDHAPKTVLYGIYDVEQFVRNGQALPPLTTDSNRWDKVIIESPSHIFIRMMDDSIKRYGSEIDPVQNTFTLSTSGAQKQQYVLSYSRPDSDHLVLQGNLGNDLVDVWLRRFDESKLPLVSTGFHWIRETSKHP